MTRTPRPVKRSTESFGAIAAITPVHVRVHFGEIDAWRCAVTPNGTAALRRRARLAAASSAFDGTQPVLRQSPPILCLSISTIGTPKAAAAAATDRPPDPPPITQISGLRVSAMTLD